MAVTPTNEKMERLYYAAIEAGVIKEKSRQSSLAFLLNVSSQTVHNWEKRGPSKEALLESHRIFGVNPNWIVNNREPMFTAGICSELPEPAHSSQAAMDLHRFAQAMKAVPSDIISLIAAYGDSRVEAPDQVNGALSRLLIGLHEWVESVRDK